MATQLNIKTSYTLLGVQNRNFSFRNRNTGNVMRKASNLNIIIVTAKTVTFQ